MSSEGALSASELPAGFSADSCAEDGPPSVGEDSFSPPRKLTRHWALRASRVRPPNPPRGGPRSAAVSSRFSSPECFPRSHLRAQPPAEGAQLFEWVCFLFAHGLQYILTFGKREARKFPEKTVDSAGACRFTRHTSRKNCSKVLTYRPLSVFFRQGRKCLKNRAQAA